jgi:hypothetical protein
VGDELLAVRGRDLLGEPADEHAPAGAGVPVDLVDLEGDVGVLDGVEFRAGGHPHHDHIPVHPPSRPISWVASSR